MAKRNTHKVQDTDALDGVLGAARNTLLLCPRCVPGLLEILDFPAPFLTLETMVERSLFRLALISVYNNLTGAAER